MKFEYRKWKWQPCDYRTDHKTAPDQFARHARVAHVASPITVHRNVIQPQNPVDQAGPLAGAQEPEEISQTGDHRHIVCPLLRGLQPFDVLTAEGGHIAAVAQRHVQHIVQHQAGALQLGRIVADEEQLLAEGCELSVYRIVPEGGAQTQVKFGLVSG